MAAPDDSRRSLRAANSVARRVPPADDAVLMAQRDVAVRIFPRCSIKGSVADAAARGHCQHLFYALFGLVPEFHLVRQILATGRQSVEPHRLAPGVAGARHRRPTPNSRTP